MQLSQKKKMIVVAAAVALGVASGCGGKIKAPFEQAAIAVRHVEQEVWVDFSGVFKTGNLNLPSASYTLTKNGRTYGTIELRGLLGGGGTEAVLSLNFTAVSKLKAGDGKLPNGLMIPIAGIENMTVVDLEIGNGKSRVYVGIGSGGFLGYTLVISQMDAVGRGVAPYHAFLGGAFQGVNFSAGIFAGPNPGESGLGVFADISGISAQLGSGGMLQAMSVSAKPAPVQFTNAGKRQVNALAPKIQKLLRKPVAATIQ